MNIDYSKRRALDKQKLSNSKKSKIAISAQEKQKIRGGKNLSIRDVVKAVIVSAKSKKEDHTCIYTLFTHLPKTQPNYLDPDSKKEQIPLRLPQWKDTPIQLRSCMYQLAMVETEKNTEKELIPFTFLLSEDLSNKSIQQSVKANEEDRVSAETDYLRKRLTDSLRRSLQREKGDSVKLWFSLEFAPKPSEDEDGKMVTKGRPHIQGSILLFPHELKKAREAFYRLNKVESIHDPDKCYWLRWGYKCRQNLIHGLNGVEKRGQLATNLNWASYNTKETSRGRWQFTGGRTNTSAAQSVKTRARELYNELRAMHKNSPQKAPQSEWGSW